MQWQHLWDLIESEGFFPGLGAGFCIAYLFIILQTITRSRYMQDCAKRESAIKLGDTFYYIVPERLYNKMNPLAAKASLLLDELNNERVD